MAEIGSLADAVAAAIHDGDAVAAQRCTGPRTVITGLGILEPGPNTCELTLTGIFPGVEVAEGRARTGWELAAPAPPVLLSPPPGTGLAALRALQAATGA